MPNIKSQKDRVVQAAAAAGITSAILFAFLAALVFRAKS